MKTRTPVSQPPRSDPARADIAHLAYQFYVERGFAPGHEDEDWHRAERELKTRPQKDRDLVGMAVARVDSI